MKKALISGVTGQDGSYLAELLLDKGYEVHAIIRRSSTKTTERMQHLYEKNHFYTHTGDIDDAASLFQIIGSLKPDECYNLAAQSHVKESFAVPAYTAHITGTAVVYFLEAIRQLSPKTKFYQASSSEMFGKVKAVPQNEETPFHPRSPYGVAKLYAHWITVNYRESYNLFAVSGILFNHESERRGSTFVTKKITRNLAAIEKGRTEPLQLGNLDAKRDWGHAEDYVKAMWLMLQQGAPDDYVISTGETHSVREFVEEAARICGFDIEWKGKGLEEKGIDKKTGRTIVEIREKYFRPAEVDLLIGDSTKAREKLGWEPKIKFKELVARMIEDDRKR